MGIRKPADKGQIFSEAADISDAVQRAAYLDQACGADQALRAEVDALLRHDAEVGDFLEQPLAGPLPTMARCGLDGADRMALTCDLRFLAPASDPRQLGKLAHYEVLELIGRGGMGLVLRALDPKLNRVVAIKVMAPELAANPMAVKRFLREAQAAAAVSHVHVVTIHAIHEDHRPPFIVMEFVDGCSLQEKVNRQGALQLTEILRIGMQIAEGLAAAHRQGLVHRDIKPANILLENGVERVKITDFGLARAVDDVGVTQTGHIAGTPQYMSPEQAQGQLLDTRSDLFSLGSVLYTVCTGRPPFRAETTVAMLRRVTDDRPRSVREINADIPEWLEAIIGKLLEKNPADRFQSPDEVAELLSRHLAHLQHPDRMPLPEPISKRTPGLVVDDELEFAETSLRIYGWIAVIWATVALVFAAIVLTFPGNYTARFFQLNAPMAMVTGLLSMVTGTLALFGRRHVAHRESWTSAMIGNFAALLPVNPPLLFAVPWCIASLIKLRHPLVRRAFALPEISERSAAEQYRAPKIVGDGPPGRRPTSIVWLVFGMLGVATTAGLMLLLYAVTDYGTLKIESVNDNLEIQIARPSSDTHDGMHVTIVERIQGSGTVRLRAGHYRLLMMYGPDVNANVPVQYFQLSKEQFVMPRGGEVVIQVMQRPMQGPVTK